MKKLQIGVDGRLANTYNAGILGPYLIISLEAFPAYRAYADKKGEHAGTEREREREREEAAEAMRCPRRQRGLEQGEREGPWPPGARGAGRGPEAQKRRIRPGNSGNAVGGRHEPLLR
ncbi:MAG: hypothetical protein Q8M54_10360 [Desulfobaccales bacterium]|nr:hypothetical protein [Desulfobaccales bacterium]